MRKKTYQLMVLGLTLFLFTGIPDAYAGPNEDKLLHAIHTKDSHAISEAIQAGFDPQLKIGKLPLLFYFVQEDDLEHVRQLLQKNLSANASDGMLPALILALLHCNHDMATLLMAHGADLELQAIDGTTPLIAAAYGGDIEIVQQLISAHVNLEAVKLTHDSALHAASFMGHAEIVRLLLDAGANLNATDILGFTALSSAAGQGNLEVVQLLLLQHPQLNTSANTFGPALTQAVAGGHTEVVKELIKAGANLDMPSFSGQTALMKAVELGNLQMVDLLLDAGANPEIASDFETALILAIKLKNTALARHLLDRGVNAKTPNRSGTTPCMFAAGEGNLELVRLLLSKGADINFQSPEWGTALMWAVSGTPAMVQLLLENGADPRAKNQKGQSVLELARNYRNKQIIRLIEKAL